VAEAGFMSMSAFAQPPRLRVVQVSFHLDHEQRDAESLLRAWPTLPAVATAAARADVDVTVVQRAHKRETIERAGVSYHFVDEPRRQPTRVLKCVTALKPDVVHAQGLNFPRAIGSLSRVLPDVPLLVQDHGTVPPTGWRASAWRWAYRSLAGVAFTAREQATSWKHAKILRADLPVFEVLESSTYFTPGDHQAARCAANMFGAPCLLWTSRLNDNKDPLTMLAAVEQAARRLPGLRLWCCFGDAPLLGVVKQRIARSAVLAERVMLLGARPHEEMELRFRAADFYLQTSHREGSGYSLLEALACGATPLVTDIPAARQIVGAVGSLTPVGDSRSLGDAIVAWAARDQQALRRAARARFDEVLTFDAIGRQLRGAYETLAGMSAAETR
jgi:glycosyltransferase involved in cell wall biosynthesis